MIEFKHPSRGPIRAYVGDADMHGFVTSAAGLDVVSPEPLPDGHRLLAHPNTVMTPHTAGVTTEATNRLAHSACDQITAALAGRLPTFPVNGEVWDAANSRRPS